MDIDNEFKLKCVEIMEKSEMIYFSTLNKDMYPETRCVFNLRNRTEFPNFTKIYEQEENQFAIYIGTNTSSQKFSELQANAKCAVYYCMPENFHGICFTGEAVIIEDLNVKEKFWEESWTQYYPQGPNDPDYTLLKIVPNKARGWYTPNKFEFTIE